MSFTDTKAARTCGPRSRSTSSASTTTRKALSDATFRKSALNTAYFVILGVPLTLVVALAAAVALDRGIKKFRSLFRLGFYLPVVTSIVAVAVVWRFLLQDRTRPDQHRPRLGRHRRARTGSGRPQLGDAVADHDGGLAQLRHRDDHLPGRAAGRAADAARGGRRSTARAPGSGSGTSPCRCCARRSSSSASPPVDRLPAVLRGAVRDDPRRPARTAPSRCRCTPTSSSASATTGYAAAMSYIIFVVIAVVTAIQFRLLERTREAAMNSVQTTSTLVALPASLRRSACRRRARAPFVWMVLGSFKTQGELRQSPADVVAGEPVARQLHAAVLARLNFGAYFVNSAIVARRRHGGQPALLLDARLRAGHARLQGQERRCSSLVHGHADDPGRRHLRAAVRARRERRARRHPAGPVPAVPGRAVRRLPDAAVHPRPARATCSTPAGSTAPASCGIFARIILPLCGPALATLGILTFLGTWNNFLWPLVVAQTEDKYTLPVALALYSTGPERHELRPAARRGHRRRHPDPRCLPGLPAPRSSKASPPPASSSRPHGTGVPDHVNRQTTSPNTPSPTATLLVGGTALLAALGARADRASAAAGTPQPARWHAASGNVQLAACAAGPRDTWHSLVAMTDPSDRPARRQHPRVAGGR